jgi:hypothetical protein
MSNNNSTTAILERLAVNAPVEVRNDELGIWTGGFHIAAVVSDGYLVRRLSDGFVLPVKFSWYEVHPA